MRSTAKRKVVHACPECGRAMTYEAREDHVEYRGQRRAFKTTAWWCPECHESIQDGSALKIAERAFVELRAEVDAILLPEQVARVRERLGISQREAGRLLGGGPRAFQKYEAGKVPVSEPMKNLLILLGNDPSRLAELETNKGPTRRKPLSSRSRSATSASDAIARGAHVPGGRLAEGVVEWVEYDVQKGVRRSPAKRAKTEPKRRTPEKRTAQRPAGR